MNLVASVVFINAISLLFVKDDSCLEMVDENLMFVVWMG